MRLRGRSMLPPSLCDARYDKLQDRLRTIDRVDVPTLMVQGAADACDPPELSEGQETYFAAGCTRIVLDGVGHFPPREAPEKTAAAIISHFRGQRTE